ncbi:MAG: QsdR family transcriptional regulator [Solirubrobacterales bacterium]
MPAKTPSAEGSRPSATFRRPTREDAISLARERFLAGDRVEMRALATELQIARATLYRWVGEREQLLDIVFSGLVDEWFAEVEPQAKGTGQARLLDVIRRFLEFAAASQPLSDFAGREPALTMKLLLDREGLVAGRSKAAIRRLLKEEVPESDVPDNIIEAIDMTAVSLVWANIAIGREPDIEGAVTLSETLLGVCE